MTDVSYATIRYYLQTRSLGWVLPAVVLALLAGSLQASTQNNSASLMPGIVVPGLLAGVVQGALVVSPFGELDDPHRDSLRGIRFGTVIVSLLTVTAVYESVGRIAYAMEDADQVITRAMIGSCGITLVCVRVLGRTRAWVLPGIWGMGAIVSRGSDGEYPWWAWQMQPVATLWAWGVAVLLLAIGLAALWNMPFLKGQ